MDEGIQSGCVERLCGDRQQEDGSTDRNAFRSQVRGPCSCIWTPFVSIHIGALMCGLLLTEQLSHDVMTDMAFGGGSEMLRDGDVTGHWAMIDSGMRYY